MFDEIADVFSPSLAALCYEEAEDAVPVYTPEARAAILQEMAAIVGGLHEAA